MEEVLHLVLPGSEGSEEGAVEGVGAHRLRQLTEVQLEEEGGRRRGVVLEGEMRGEVEWCW